MLRMNPLPAFLNGCLQAHQVCTPQSEGYSLAKTSLNGVSPHHKMPRSPAIKCSISTFADAPSEQTLAGWGQLTALSQHSRAKTQTGNRLRALQNTATRIWAPVSMRRPLGVTPSLGV